jgi:endonuclease G
VCACARGGIPSVGVQYDFVEDRRHRRPGSLKEVGVNWIIRGATIALLLLAAPASTSALQPVEYCKGTSAGAVKKFDGATLLLSKQEIVDAEAKHLPWGYPSRDKKLLYHREFVFQYDVTRKVPVWASYRLEAKDVSGGVPRKDSFRTDPRLLEDETAHCNDYAGSSYDRGHNVSNGDMNRSPRAQAHSFFLANMAPQRHVFNDGIWKYFETTVRAWAKKPRGVYVVTGSIFDWDEDGRPDAETKWVGASKRVGVPSHFFKIVVRETGSGELETLAAVLPHRNERIAGDNRAPYLKKHLVPVSEIEKLTGLKFFSEMKAFEREKLERAVASELWPRN